MSCVRYPLPRLQRHEALTSTCETERDGASLCPRSAGRGRADQGRGRAPRSFSVDQAVASWCNRALFGGQASLPSREPRCSISRLLVGLMWPSRPYLSAVPQRCWDVEHAHRRHQLLVENAASIPAVNSEELNHSLAVSEIIAISGLRVTMLLVTCF